MTQRIDWAFYDVQRSFDRHDPDPRILLVAIDDESLSEIGPWPWPRERHAELIDVLGAADALAVGYDVLFMEENPGDADLARAISTSQVILPLVVERPGLNGADRQIRKPIAILRNVAKGLGHVGIAGDLDGPIRRANLWDEGTKGNVPHMSMLIAEEVGANPHMDGEILIPFSGQSGHYPAISAAAVLRGQVPDELLRDRIVLVGATAQGLGDQHQVAVGAGGTMSGVEIQANVLDGLLNDKLISEGNAFQRITLALIFLWLALTLHNIFATANSLGILTATALSTIGFSALMLIFARIWIAPGTSIVTLATFYPIWNWKQLAAAHQYMSEILSRLRADPKSLIAPVNINSNADQFAFHASNINIALTNLQESKLFISSIIGQIPYAVSIYDKFGTILFHNDNSTVAGNEFENEHTIFDLISGMRAAADYEMLSLVPPRYGSAVLEDAQGRSFSLTIAPWIGSGDNSGASIATLGEITNLREIERQREELVGFLSHDIRSPQVSILACLANAKIGDIDLGLANRIDGFAKRTLHLADGFVRLARAEGQKYNFTSYILADAMIDAVDELWPQSQNKEVEISMSGERFGIEVNGDRSLITRALINLLSNALRASPRSGLIEINIEPYVISKRNAALFSVRDRGPGVPEDLQNKLFTRFYSHTSNDFAHGGIGLGLAFVNAVAKGHRGRAWCESKIGEGACFFLAIDSDPTQRASPQ